MYQDIAKADDLWRIGQQGHNVRSNSAEPDERFSDDFKLAFNCGAQHVVRKVVVEAAAGGKSRNPYHRPLHIPEILCCSGRDIGGG